MTQPLKSPNPIHPTRYAYHPALPHGIPDVPVPPPPPGLSYSEYQAHSDMRVEMGFPPLPGCRKPEPLSPAPVYCIRTDAPLTASAKERIKAEWEKVWEGTGHSAKLLILDCGMELIGGLQAQPNPEPESEDKENILPLWPCAYCGQDNPNSAVRCEQCGGRREDEEKQKDDLRINGSPTESVPITAQWERGEDGRLYYAGTFIPVPDWNEKEWPGLAPFITRKVTDLWNWIVYILMGDSS